MKKALLFAIAVLCIRLYPPAIIYAVELEPQSAIAEDETTIVDPNDVLPEIIAPAVVLMDADSGVILYERNMDKRYYPASITKVMTALLSIEYAQGDMSQRVPFSHEAVFSLPYGSSHIAMDEDETLTMEDALYGLMLQSANEVANALAEYVGGDIETFAAMMNERARELGAVNTHFSNPHGLHSEDHYTTARDMALIMQEAVKSPQFVHFISTKRHDIPPTERQPLSRPLNNTNKLIQPGQYFYEDAVGGKTGYTNEARHTLVSYAQKEGRNLIAVTLNDEKGAIYTDAICMYDYGFTQFEEVLLFEKDSFQEEVPVMQEQDGTLMEIGKVPVKAAADETLRRILPKCVAGKVILSVDLPKALTAPVQEGDELGKITLLYQGQHLPLGEIPLRAALTVMPMPVNDIQDTSTVSDGGGRVTALYLALAAASLVVLAISGSLFISVYNKRKRRSWARYPAIRNYKYKNTYRRY